MVNEIINGIVTAIYNVFGDDYEIYTENIEQGLREPCFYIECIKQNSDLFRNDIYFSVYDFVLQYFPSTDKKNYECNQVFSKIFSCLELIEVGDNLIRCRNINASINDDILTISFDIEINTRKDKAEKDINMENYKTDYIVKR